jgi:putative DNA primase/helicase
MSLPPDASGAGYRVSDAPIETLAETVDLLAAMGPLEYDLVREAEAKRLTVRVRTLDMEVARARPGGDDLSGRPFALTDHQPWPEPVETADLLDSLASAIRRHLILSAAAIDVIALWIAHT